MVMVIMVTYKLLFYTLFLRSSEPKSESVFKFSVELIQYRPFYTAQATLHSAFHSTQYRTHSQYRALYTVEVTLQNIGHFTEYT